MKPGLGPGVRENACLRTSLDVGTVWDSMHVIFLRSWCYVLSYPLKPHSRLSGRAVVPCLWLGGGAFHEMSGGAYVGLFDLVFVWANVIFFFLFGDYLAKL